MGGLVSEVGDLFGGAPNNANFQAQGANIQNPTTSAQAGQVYGQTQQGLGQQQQLAQQLAGQNGIGNQSSVFNQQQALANQLQQNALGQGPNPAQAALNQATGQNTANTASLLASQRGAGANVGLLGRNIANQGAQNQQQAAGQSAVMQAQQQLAAQQQLGQQQAQMAGLAGQQVGQQANAIQGYNSAAQGLQGNVLNSINSQNNANVGMQSNINSANAGLAQTNANNSAKAVGGLFSGLAGAGGTLVGGSGGSALTALAAGYSGGSVEQGAINPKIAAVAPKDRFKGALPPHIEHIARIYHPEKFALGGPVQTQSTNAQMGTSFQNNQSQLGQGNGKSSTSPTSNGINQKTALAGGGDSLNSSGQMYAAKGGKVPALLSPGEVYLPPNKAKEVAQTGKNPLKEGEKIPGKAPVKGNSLKNDIVPKNLEEGGVVIPRSVMESSDPVGNAAKFVQEHMKKNDGGKEQMDFKSALKNAMATRRAK